MSASNVRVLAIWEDDPTESPLTIDLRVNAVTKRILGRWSVFGAVDLAGPQCAPFILQADGVIDFGVGKLDDRRWRTDLRDCNITVGTRFSLRWNEQDSAIYRIEKVAALGSKEI